MRFVIQVVTNSDVKIDGKVRGAIDRGYMVLIGVGKMTPGKQQIR